MLNNSERIRRLELAIVEALKLLKWIEGRDNTWQSVWDRLDEIVAEIKAENET